MHGSLPADGDGHLASVAVTTMLPSASEMSLRSPRVRRKLGAGLPRPWGARRRCQWIALERDVGHGLSSPPTAAQVGRRLPCYHALDPPRRPGRCGVGKRPPAHLLVELKLGIGRKPSVLDWPATSCRPTLHVRSWLTHRLRADQVLLPGRTAVAATGGGIRCSAASTRCAFWRMHGPGDCPQHPPAQDNLRLFKTASGWRRCSRKPLARR